MKRKFRGRPRRDRPPRVGSVAGRSASKPTATAFPCSAPYSPLAGAICSRQRAAGAALALLGPRRYRAGERELGSFGQVSGVEKGNLVTNGPYRYSRNPQVESSRHTGSVALLMIGGNRRLIRTPERAQRTVKR